MQRNRSVAVGGNVSLLVLHRSLLHFLEEMTEPKKEVINGTEDRLPVYMKRINSNVKRLFIFLSKMY